jgi:hypothetical protein
MKSSEVGHLSFMEYVPKQGETLIEDNEASEEVVELFDPSFAKTNSTLE